MGNRQKLEKLEHVVRGLKQSPSLAEKIDCLNQALGQDTAGSDLEYEVIQKSLQVIGEWERIERGGDPLSVIESLKPVERFYQEIGGIVGYHFLILCYIHEHSQAVQEENTYHMPQVIALEPGSEYVEAGLAALPLLAEIYPVGGAADRLRLIDLKTQVPLPAARLQFGYKNLLQWMIEDVQAREYLYYKRYGKRVIVPLAMMTSEEKDNHAQIIECCEENKWFGRPKESFFLFSQPLVPTVDREGHWVVTPQGKLLLKPGGHGVIWKLAKDLKVLEWMQQQGRTKLLVRQINNPVAGCDEGLLALIGIGCVQNKAFGIASCPRQVHAAEGVNVKVEKCGRSHLTCIEYCDFKRLNLADEPAEPGGKYSKYPSNTNLIFADIQAVIEAVEQTPLPGMIINFKKVPFLHGEVEVARLESTMQNLSDHFEVDRTFLTYQDRHKTISAIKKEWDGKGSVLETPEGCVWDFYQNAQDLLKNYCNFTLPPLLTMDAYQGKGLPYQLWYHPALGPLYTEIGKKLRKGEIKEGSEWRIEIAEMDVEDLYLDGRLWIRGADLENTRCQLHRVRVENQGDQRCEIILHPGSSFEASDLQLIGDLRIEVPAGHRMTWTT